MHVYMYVHLLGVFDELCTGMQATEIKKKKEQNFNKIHQVPKFFESLDSFPTWFVFHN